MIERSTIYIILVALSTLACRLDANSMDKAPYSELLTEHNYYSNPLVGERILVYTLVGAGIPYKDQKHSFQKHSFPAFSGTFAVGCRKDLNENARVPIFDCSIECALSSSRMRGGVQLALLGFADPRHRNVCCGFGFRTGWERIQKSTEIAINKGYWDIPLIIGTHFSLKYSDVVPILQFRISLKEADFSCGTAF